MTERIPVTNIPVANHRPATSQPIVTKGFSGRFRNLRIGGGVLLFFLYFGTVWLPWNGQQAVLWDISQRQFHIFGATFWPEDLTLLMAGLVVCAFGLFFITVLAGRVWCGYACPQSMWTWLFLWAEKVTEGDRNQRIRLNQAPWGADKLFRRFQKHGLWLLISAATALTFVGYFTPIRPLVTELLTLETGAMTAFWLFFFTAATYINAGWLREKVCLHMCPYGRFQSVMLDDDSVVISYDSARGEPRGHRKREVAPAKQGLGDCIDCQQCVQVCPTGIDIRDGLQMACIGCAACIDACDSIMDRMGYDRGLVRYASQNQLAGGRFRPFRPRLAGYAVVLGVMVAALVWAVASRPLVSLDVAKDRTLFRYDGAGRVENSYQLRLLNKSTVTGQYQLAVEGPAGLALEGSTDITLAPGESRDLALVVSVPPEQLEQLSTELIFTAVNRLEPEHSARQGSAFTGPAWY
ncbi:cytochrome c oxidase accessory protein CcoG [Marinobacter zhejiangensis]|uniref:Cytochrome c oxidase accessory protein FixG n=1 Tax=Marinobacter zhejiangensis TaxID=488535 RepID=A0A1I4L0Y3_9GAMM|nr:cytochrome c oxidase accessory protein CcoG [Marinobacter zhejiangensis]SFL84297.1 cytochrome c oxidase accessory protein FixG [Marinobacter zhejiangensis]